MRYYATITPKIWTGSTGRYLRGIKDAQIVQSYILSSPHANMYGVYYCPINSITHDTGLSQKDATYGMGILTGEVEAPSKPLRSPFEGGVEPFCTYDWVEEVIFIHNMAREQIGKELKASDNRVKSVKKFFYKLENSFIKQLFYERYKNSYYLSDYELSTEAPSKPLWSPFEAPSKPGTGSGTGSSKEKKMEQKKENFKSQAIEVLNFLNEKTGRNYRPADVNLKLI